ncbi:MAG: glycosyltransferase [Oscillospiraceae bacterium]|nr:glycosyltransferase [Oscillospiraceae bacterium]
MKLSIIVPVYNVEKYLAACLDSLMDESVGDYEVIAVNDGSTDGSRAILSDYEARYPLTLHVLDTTNGGLGHARNVGMSAAQGEYLLFVDSDDTLTAGAVREIISGLDGTYDIGIFDFVHVDESGKELATFTGCPREDDFCFEDYPELLLCPFNTCNKLWKRSLFEKLQLTFPPRIWFEDVATSPKLYLASGTIRPIHRPWYRYLQRSGTIMNAKTGERYTEMITVYGMILDWYRAEGVYEKYRKELEYMGFYHEYLTSVVRVNLLDASSELQDRFCEDYLRRFPNYRLNTYYQQAPKKYHFLDRLIRGRHWKAVHAVMSLNNKLKGR